MLILEAAISSTNIGPVFLSLVAFLVLAVVSVGLPPPGRARSDVCAACGYSRAGLAAQALCPECGEQAPDNPPPAAGDAVRPEGWLNVAFATALFGTSCLMVRSMIRVALLISYRLDGFSDSAASLAVSSRELARFDFMSDAPLLFASLMVNPLFIRFVSPRKARWSMVFLTVVAAVVTFTSRAVP